MDESAPESGGEKYPRSVNSPEYPRYERTRRAKSKKSMSFSTLLLSPGLSSARCFSTKTTHRVTFANSVCVVIVCTELVPERSKTRSKVDTFFSAEPSTERGERKIAGEYRASSRVVARRESRGRDRSHARTGGMHVLCFSERRSREARDEARGGARKTAAERDTACATRADLPRRLIAPD